MNARPVRGQPARGGGLDTPRARVAFRDRSVSDVLDLALRFLVVQGRTYAKVALGSLVPLSAISLAAWVEARVGSVMGGRAAARRDRRDPFHGPRITARLPGSRPRT